MDSMLVHGKSPEIQIPSSSKTSEELKQHIDHGRKRKLSVELENSCVEPEPKHQVTESVNIISKATEHLADNSHINLLDLSDEILLLIFKHLDSNSLLPLSKVCVRLNRLVADKTLWKDADFTSVKLVTVEVYKRIKYLQPFITKSLKLRGMTSVYPADQWNVPTLTPGILKSIETRLLLLEHLELTEAYFDMNEISIIMFPQTLRSLVLRKCALSAQNISNHFIQPNQQMRSFLSNMYKYFVHLEELTIEYCAWFDTHDFMVLSKLPNLRYLSLKGCANIKDSVPYASLATRFGFKKLEVLDLRDTPISDSDVSCFNIVHSLKELKLECPEHLRTETGLHEYNRAERQRVEQLHRLAVPDPHPNENDAGGDRLAVRQMGNAIQVEGAPLPILRPAHGVFEIRVIRGDYPGQVRRNQDNLIRIVRGREGVMLNNQRPQLPNLAVGRQRSPPIPAVGPQARAGSPLNDQNQQQDQNQPIQPVLAGPLPFRGDGNNQNNVDRQHIVRIINRDLLLHRRENVELNNAHPILRRAGEQMNAAYQRIFDADGNYAQRRRAFDPELDREPAVIRDRNENDRAEPEQPVENVHLQFNDARNGPDRNNDPEDEQPQPVPQLNNNPPQRVLPHVIIMPGNFPEHFPEMIHGPGRGYQHQVFVNLGMGQPAPNNVSLVSDRGICAYGVSRNELAGAFNAAVLHPNFSGLERLSVRNYKLVTDTSLDHLESAAPNLKLLDVTGTSVTDEGVRNFRLSRPSCVLISSFDQIES